MEEVSKISTLNQDSNLVRAEVSAVLTSFVFAYGEYQYFLRLIRQNGKNTEFDHQFSMPSYERTSYKYKAEDPDIVAMRKITNSVLKTLEPWFLKNDPDMMNVLIYFNDSDVGTKVSLYEGI